MSTGCNVPKIDGDKLVRGLPAFVDDITPAGLLYAKVLRSPHAHARIKNVDITKAMALAGVVDVIWHKDVKQIPHTRAGQSYPEPSPYDYTVMPTKARFIGDRVAVVVAVSLRIAEDALGLIDVEYEVLPSVTDFTQALDSDVLIHEEPDPRGISKGGESNLAAMIDVHLGDVDKALEECDVVISRVYNLPRVQAAHVEPHISMAWIDEDNRLIVRTSTQVPFHLRRMLATVLEMPESKIRVIKPRVGGGFGDKQELVCEDLVSVLAIRSGKPVRLEFTREEEFIAARLRHRQRITMTTGAMKDGTLVANRMEVLADTGAYGSHALTVQANTGQKTLPLYPMDNIHYHVDSVYTNNPISGAFRGYGAPQGFFALECQIDEVAKELGMDRLELRKKNHIKLGEDDPISAHLNEGKPGMARRMNSCALAECIVSGAEAIGWNNKQEPTHPRFRRGIGVGLAMQGSGIAGVDWGAATVKLNDDCSVNLFVGATDIGQGSDTVLSQMCADELGIDYEKIVMLSSDTDLTPFDVGAYASSTTYVSGGAVVKAATQLREQLADVLAAEWDVPAEDIIFAGNKASCGDHSMTMIEVANYAFYEAKIQPMATASFTSDDSPAPFAAQFADVEVDTETGQVFV
ncbi:molybdopterin-dependent oxidoreductase, partial [bacterium]|nr:molybdopterin-dependent oxidoreductase [bacterium]